MDGNNKYNLPPESQRCFLHLPLNILKRCTNIREIVKNEIKSKHTNNNKSSDQNVEVDIQIKKIYDNLQCGIWCTELEFINNHTESNNPPGILTLVGNNVMKYNEEARDLFYRKFDEQIKPFLYLPFDILRSTTNLDQVANEYLIKKKIDINKTNTDKAANLIYQNIQKYRGADDRKNVYELEKLKFIDIVS